MTKKMSNFERLSILLQASMHPKCNVDFEVDPNFISEVVAMGHEWALTWKYDSILQKEAHPHDEIVQEICEIFDTYLHIQRSAIELGIDPARVKFPGFDANNDEHYAIAGTLVNQLDRYTDLDGAGNNSHSSASLHSYRKMVEMRNNILSGFAGIYRTLTAEEIDQLLLC